MRRHGLQIGDLGARGRDFKSNNGAIMPDTCLGENQETNINIYTSISLFLYAPGDGRGATTRSWRKASFVFRSENITPAITSRNSLDNLTILPTNSESCGENSVQLKWNFHSADISKIVR